MSRWTVHKLPLWNSFAGAVVTTLLLLAAPVMAEPVTSGSVKVVDGDTVDVGTIRYRLVGFDTPETEGRARCSAERKLAADAALRLRDLIAAGNTDLQRVPCNCKRGTEGTDRCNGGRLCGVLRVAGKDVGAILISEGLARPYICKGTRCPRRGTWCGRR